MKTKAQIEEAALVEMECGDTIPEQCWECGAYNAIGKAWPRVRVDDDPGDPEAGPHPSLCDVALCPECSA